MTTLFALLARPSSVEEACQLQQENYARINTLLSLLNSANVVLHQLRTSMAKLEQENKVNVVIKHG
jgi:hypothetical protein